jgi:hypothetical protein
MSAARAIVYPQPTMYSEEEYLRLENDAFEKSEYFQGQIFKMAGAAQWIVADDAFSLTESITIQTIGATLQMADLYDRIENVSSLLPPVEE